MPYPIVILHGWGSDIQSWQPLKTLLIKKSLKVYLPILPGFNHQPIKTPLSTQDYSAWLAKYLKAKKLKTVNLVCHSFGGQIAINFTASHPQQVNQLILINSAGIRNHLNFKRLIFTPFAKLGKLVFDLPPCKFVQPLAQQALYRFLRETDYLKANPVMKQTLQKVLTEDQQAQMKKITRPTLILWAAKDTYTPLKYGRLIHQLIKSSKLIIIPQATHGLPFQQPQLVAKKILWFIS